MECDFCGWATKNNVRCSDGLTILQNAFEGNNGGRVPLVWMHDHSDPTNTIGHADLENRDEGVYAYGYFNDSEKARAAKAAVLNGDVTSMSIFAGHVRKNGNYVTHGDIKEVSLVLAGANPGARIENVIKHSDGDFEEEECDLYLDIGDGIGFIQHADDDDEDDISHADDKEKEEKEPNNSDSSKEDKGETVGDIIKTFNEKQRNVLAFLIEEAVKKAKGENVEHSDDNEDVIEHAEDGEEKNKTVEDVVNGMNEEQKKVMYYLIAKAVEEAKNGGKEDMAEIKHNVFDNEDGVYEAAPISHADQAMILANARKSNVGSFQTALKQYLSEHDEYADVIQHGWEDVTQLFPEWHDMMTGAPEAIPEDIAWVATVMRGVTKSPFSRIRTRQADIQAIKAVGYKTKGSKKHDTGTISLVTRTTDPQTIYIKDKMDRDDIVDITDFDVVSYMQSLMRQALEEKVAQAILIGDGLEPGSEDKIEESHIRSIWNDDDLYSMHFDVDFAKAKADIQGTNTKVDFGDNYIRTEAFIEAALYSREKYKGRGKPVMFCEPHMINTMLMARDMNGRRIYNTVTELASALNVSAIHTVEDFADKTRTVNQDGMKTKKLLAIFVNLSDYHVGSTKGGQISSFNDFDIDYNQEKFLQETRLSGALTRVKSAIVLEEDITA